MATCFCKQPCEKHTFGSDAWRANEKERWQEFIRKGYVELHEKYENKDLGKHLEAYRVSK